MKKLFFALFIILIGLQSQAQSYGYGIGVRGGVTNGITFKMISGGSGAIEGIFGYGFRSARLTGLYEMHTGAFDVEGLNWFYGAGGHIAFYSYRTTGDWRWNGYRWELNPYYTGNGTNSSMGFGIDGILGIEYEIQEIPFTVGFDIKPALEFNTLGYFPFMFWDGAFSLRYVW